MALGVIFDCDGVLVDSERINNEVMAELATQAGVPLTYQQCVTRFMGRATDDCVADLEQQLGRPADFDIAAAYERLSLERQRGELTAVPGVRELLDRLRVLSVPVCVASSSTPEEIDARLDMTALSNYFGEHRYSATMVDRGKPDPDLFLLAAHAIGVDPAACFVIEDSVYGVQAGRAAGMTVIGYSALAADEALLAAGADHVIRDMRQVPRLLPG